MPRIAPLNPSQYAALLRAKKVTIMHNRSGELVVVAWRAIAEQEAGRYLAQAVARPG